MVVFREFAHEVGCSLIIQDNLPNCLDIKLRKNMSGVYIQLRKRGEIYIGEAVDILDRQKEHLKKGVKLAALAVLFVDMIDTQGRKNLETTVIAAAQRKGLWLANISKTKLAEELNRRAEQLSVQAAVQKLVSKRRSSRQQVHARPHDRNKLGRSRRQCDNFRARRRGSVYFGDAFGVRRARALFGLSFDSQRRPLRRGGQKRRPRRVGTHPPHRFVPRDARRAARAGHGKRRRSPCKHSARAALRSAAAARRRCKFYNPHAASRRILFRARGRGRS